MPLEGFKVCQETRKILFNTPKTEHIAHKMNRKKCSTSTVKTSKRLKASFSIYWVSRNKEPQYRFVSTKK